MACASIVSLKYVRYAKAYMTKEHEIRNILKLIAVKTGGSPI